MKRHTPPAGTGGCSLDLITNWLPFEGDTTEGTPFIIIIETLIPGGKKLKPQWPQLIRKNDGLNVSSGDIIFPNSFKFDIVTFGVCLHYRTTCSQIQFPDPAANGFQGGVDWISNKDTCTPVSPKQQVVYLKASETQMQTSDCLSLSASVQRSSGLFACIFFFFLLFHRPSWWCLSECGTCLLGH